MKKIILTLLLSTLILSGCGLATSKQATNQVLQQNVTTKTGTLSTKTSDSYLLTTSDGIVNIASTKVNLDNYMKKKITVTGMYSGDILYVDKLTAN